MVTVGFDGVLSKDEGEKAGGRRGGDGNGDSAPGKEVIDVGEVVFDGGDGLVFFFKILLEIIQDILKIN